MVSWCDKLASTPTIGLKLDWDFKSGAHLLDVLSPILNHSIKGDRPRFTVDKVDNHSVVLTTENGYQYAIDAQKIAVAFHHRMKILPVSRDAPRAELLTSLRPFTVELEELISRTVEVARLISSGSRKVLRVGVISTTTVAPEDVPPGVERFMKFIGRPWAGKVNYFTTSVTAELAERGEGSDRCIHTLAKQEENQEGMMVLVFDWQRTLSRPQAHSERTLRELLVRCRDEALHYFEELAEGTMFDDDLVGQND